MGAKMGCLWQELFTELAGYCLPEMGSKSSDLKGAELGSHLAGSVRIEFLSSFFLLFLSWLSSFLLFIFVFTTLLMSSKVDETNWT